MRIMLFLIRFLFVGYKSIHSDFVNDFFKFPIDDDTAASLFLAALCFKNLIKFQIILTIHCVEFLYFGYWIPPFFCILNAN
jgi:hypothetical protein